ncbi:MAG: hypothetical protein HYV28_13285, partial [Ignavibacteriales bacterium]|nr:hypothetical protein [Ignavibacteriales bacterium]
MDNKCNLFEYAINGVSNRKYFYNENSIPDFLGQKEIYHSAFLHSSEIKEYADQNDGIIKGYAGCVAIREVVIDIDCGDNLEKAQKITQGIVRKIETLYEVDAKYLRVNFSGSKGFHIRIPSVLFGDFLPSEDLPVQIRAIVKEITARYEHVDYGIYGTTKLIREVNTINAKSGLVAVPLTAEEVNCLTIAEIKNRAKSPRLVEYIDDDELLPNDGLVALKNRFLTTDAVTETEDVDVKKKIDAVEITEGGLPEGERHAGLVKLVSHFIHYNVPDKTIYAMAQLFNRNNNPPKDSAVVKGEVDGILKQYGKIKGNFWTVARNKKGYINVDVNHFQLIKFLESHGFAKLYLTNSFTYVKAVDNRIKEKMPQEIKDFILNSVKKDNQKGLSNDFRDEVMNELIAHNGKYLSDKLFECVESKEMELLKDTAKLGRVFFKNCFVEVTEDNIITRPYTELDGLIWDAQIIDNDFTIADDFEKSMFRKFLWNVSAEREDRFNSLVSSIGYLLHGYKNSSNAKAIVFCDEKISDDPNGRTGKSLASVAISKMKESVRMDGKTVNFNDRFVYQQVERSTQVLEFNDIRKSFDFEG